MSKDRASLIARIVQAFADDDEASAKVRPSRVSFVVGVAVAPQPVVSKSSERSRPSDTPSVITE